MNSVIGHSSQNENANIRRTAMIAAALGVAILMLAAGMLMLFSAKAKMPSLKNVSNADQNGYRTCEYQGITRKFILYVPKSATPNSPLVFLLHGYGGTAASIQTQTGINEAAERYGYVMVYPQGAKDPADGTAAAAWNSGLKAQGNDDVGFLKALANYLIKTYGYGKAGVFAAGFSNGAFMMYRLANEADDTFRAVASVAGFMPDSVWEARKDKASIGILQINGTKDDVVSLDVSYNAAPPIYDVIEYWKNANGLDQMDQETLSERVMAYRYTGDAMKNQVWYIEVENGGHAWPEQQYTGIDTNEIILDFFSRHM